METNIAVLLLGYVAAIVAGVTLSLRPRRSLRRANTEIRRVRTRVELHTQAKYFEYLKILEGRRNHALIDLVVPSLLVATGIAMIAISLGQPGLSAAVGVAIYWIYLEPFRLKD